MSATRAVRAWEWASPSEPVHREVLSALPDDDTGRPPLLFVHGIAHGAWCFAEHWLGAAAARGFPAYALSLRGHGGSGGHRRLGRTTTRDYVHDVLQTLVDLPSRPVIVGHSMGAVVTQLVLERYPARAAVLLAPAPLHSAVPAAVSMARHNPGGVARTIVGGTLGFRSDDLFTGLDPATAADYMSRLGRESPLVQYGLLRPRTLGSVRSPVLVVGAGGDSAVRREDVQRTASRFETEPLWFPQIGHDLMLDDGQDAVLDAVLDWVDRTVPPGSPSWPGGHAR